MRIPLAATLLMAASFGTASAADTKLAPHRASYDLHLKGQASELSGADGRIALEIAQKNCEAYELDYRFVARFQQEQELIVTDQRTTSKETVDGKRFEFETKTFVDSAAENEIRGTATNDGGQTRITLSKPEERNIEIPASLFPMQHTGSLIDHARRGERIVETAVFDGDEDADKRLTSTAIIAPAAPAETAGEGKGARTRAHEKLKGLQSWRVSESFYNSDSDADGMPIFETAYTLYENGVSDDLVLVFEGYTFEGGLASLDLLDRPSCP